MFSLLQININLLVVSLAVYDIAKLIDFQLFYFYAFIHANHREQIVYSKAINIFVSVD